MDLVELSWSTHVNTCKNTRRLIRLLYILSVLSLLISGYTETTIHELYSSTSGVCCSSLGLYINALESLQKFALKVCTKQWNTNYDNLLDLGCQHLNQELKIMFSVSSTSQSLLVLYCSLTAPSDSEYQRG